MEFEWDPKKADSNYKKHRIRFEEAQTVFLDTHAIEFFDSEHSRKAPDEERFIRIGASSKMRILLVVFCERSNSSIRIISARKAALNERDFYEKGI